MIYLYILNFACLFADDTVLILKSENIHNLEFEVNHELKIINK